MNIAVDTNILVRAVVGDHAIQSPAAAKALTDALLIAIALPCLCEFVWVLKSVYRFPREDISHAIRALVAAANVATNRPAIEAGLAILDAGGDFADGVIAHEGAWLGADTFLSFDSRAVTLLSTQGRSAQLL